jgi:hypothetical protein
MNCENKYFSILHRKRGKRQNANPILLTLNNNMMTEAEIKEIIEDEIVVDAYGDDEVSMGWHCFMSETLEFPYKAIATIKKRNGTTEECTVDVVEDATDGNRFKCQAYYVNVDYEGVLMKMEVADLKPINASDETIKAITVWKYWLEKGYY